MGLWLRNTTDIEVGQQVNEKRPHRFRWGRFLVWFGPPEGVRCSSGALRRDSCSDWLSKN